MDELSGIGRLLILAGIAIAGVGAVLLLLGKVPSEGGWTGWLGRLPGDIFIKRDSFSLYVPLATSLLLSIVVSLLWYLFSLWGKR